jgi:hypothetical protein
VTPWQLRNLALQAANGGGVRGEDLDRLTGTPVNSPPIYDLIGGWIRVYGSPGSRFSAALLGQQDWRHANQIVFPAVILILFLADAVAAPSTPATAPTVGPTPSAGNGTASGGSSGAASRGFGHGLASEHRAVLLAAHLAAGPCTALASFIQNAVAAVATALKVTAPGGGFFGFLGRVWNAAVDLAHGQAGEDHGVRVLVRDSMVASSRSLALAQAASNWPSRRLGALAQIVNASSPKIVRSL